MNDPSGALREAVLHLLHVQPRLTMHELRLRFVRQWPYAGSLPDGRAIQRALDVLLVNGQVRYDPMPGAQNNKGYYFGTYAQTVVWSLI